MAVEENRIAQLKALVESAGAASGEVDPKRQLRAGYRAVAMGAGINEEYVYQLCTGKKTRVGPDKAKAIARAFANGRDPAWFDEPISEVPKAPARGVTDSHWALIEDFRLLPDDEQEALRDKLRSKAEKVREAAREYLRRQGLVRTVSDARVEESLPPPPPRRKL